MQAGTTDPAGAGPGELFSRRLLALSDKLQHFLTLPAPGIELVGLESILPRAFGLVLIAGVPVRAPQLVIRLDQVRPQLERFLEEGLRVLIHLALQVHESEIIVRIQRSIIDFITPERTRALLARM